MNELFDLLNSSIKNEFGSKAPLTAANFEEKKIKLWRKGTVLERKGDIVQEGRNEV